MKNAAGIIIFLFISIQNCNGQEYLPYNPSYDWFFFFHELSASAEGSGKIYLDNNNDAFSSLYNPALSSNSNSIRFSYSNSQKGTSHSNFIYKTFGIDVPIKNVGTFSLVGRYSEIFIPYGPQSFEFGFYYYCYNFNYSRELLKGFNTGIGMNYFTVKGAYPTASGDPYNDIYSLNLGISYDYNLPESNYYFHFLTFNASVTNIPISNPIRKGERLNALPQIGRVSIGYISKYGMLNNVDVIQSDIQIEYSDLLNSSFYNTTSIGAELKFLDIISLRMGYYNFKDKYYLVDKITYGFGLSFPLKIISVIPLVIGADYTNLINPYYIYPPDEYFNSVTLNVRYEMH